MAKDTRTKIVTIRYYERIGLLPKPDRTQANYRLYSLEDVRRVRFIRRCRDLGFSIDGVRELLRLSSREAQPCAEVDRITARHLTEIKQKIVDLRHLAAQLRRLNECCEGDGTIGNCRIIEALSPGSATGSRGHACRQPHELYDGTREESNLWPDS